MIVGGGFCGTTAAYYLRQSDRFSIVLIDKKPFFEHTPSVIMAVADPMKWADKINYPLEKLVGKSGLFVQGAVSKITSKEVEVNGGKIAYDYLILSTGSSYSQFIKSSAMTAAFREKTIKSNFKVKKQTFQIIHVNRQLNEELNYFFHSANCR